MLLRLAGAEEDAEAFVRRRVALDELEVERDEDAARALAVLTESRLLTVEEDAVEVAHEALLSEWPRLRGWLAEDAEGRRLHQHLISASREWRDSERDPAELYRGARLVVALDWAVEHDPELNELERDFLDESRAASEREAERQRRANRRLRTLLAGVGILLAAAVVAGRDRDLRAPGARATRPEQNRPTPRRPGPSPRTVSTARPCSQAPAPPSTTRSRPASACSRRSCATPPRSASCAPTATSSTRLALSPDGRTVALGDCDGTVILFDAETRERLAEYQAPGYVTDLAFDPDGDSLAMVSRDEAQRRARRTYPHFTSSTPTPRAGAARPRSVTSVIPSTERIRDYFAILTYAPDGRSLIVAYVDRSTMGRSPCAAALECARRRPLGTRSAPPHPPARCGRRSSPRPMGACSIPSLEGPMRSIAEPLRWSGVTRSVARLAGLSANGATLAIGRQKKDASGCSISPREHMRTLRGGHSGTVQEAAFAADGRVLATAGADGAVDVWDPLEEPRDRDAHRPRPGGSRPGPRPRWTHALHGKYRFDRDHLGRRRRPSPRAPVHHRPASGSSTSSPPGVAVSPDGPTVAVGRLRRPGRPYRHRDPAQEG